VETKTSIRCFSASGKEATMLAELFRRKKAAGEKTFVAYLTAGDPSLAASARFLFALERAGADVIELGVPHSDPVADGPTNLKAAHRALASGTSLKKVLELAREVRSRGLKAPLVLFTYYNPCLKLGVRELALRSRECGVDGILVVDLPPEEAEDYVQAMREAGVATIFLASPTTAPSRLEHIARSSTGFVYYVSRTGVTGTREALSETLAPEIVRVRETITGPLCVGFGISSPAQARQVADLADGVVVGSRLVREIEESSSEEEAERRIFDTVSRLIAGMRGE
jgi:tryptophan synthase alpha chain